MRIFPARVCTLLVIAWLGASPAGVAGAPVVAWTFDAEAPALRAQAVGSVHLGEAAGPRPPEFPESDAGNTALRLDGSGARLAIADPGADSHFDFTNGDAITLEAWVDVAEIRDGENRYIIGKGRTGNAGFARDNQNWALRLRGDGGLAHVSFLFATPPEAGGEPWHRWTTDGGFNPSAGWRHVAVRYKFGEPESIGGWIDGKRVEGTWDMAGSTTKAPVVDDDAVWIGSALGGHDRTSFHGLLDGVAIHRRLLSDEELAARFRRVGAPREVLADRAPELGELAGGEVLLMVSEGLATHTKWPRKFNLNEVSKLALESFYLHRLPFRYDAWGIRESWKAPVLARMAADLRLPPGQHRVLVRTRGLSRLWVDGEKLLETKPHSGSTDGHGPVLDLPQRPAPGLSRVAYGDHETFAEIEVAEGDRAARVVFEAIVGGKKLRTDTGEMCVAIQLQGESTYRLLAPHASAAVAITDQGMAAARRRSDEVLCGFDAEKRRSAGESQAAFWSKRHEHAAKVAAARAFSESSIDGFIAAKIDRARASVGSENPAEARRFHGEVLPLLRERCFRCHSEKKKGDLRLDSRDAALAAIDLKHPEDSELLFRLNTTDLDERMPPEGEPLAESEVALLRDWIAAGAKWPRAPLPERLAKPVPEVSDAAFLRRAYLDTIGIPPREAELREFVVDEAPDKRAAAIDRLLADPRFADGWLSFWQDLLAENPNILKPSLNNSGAFRWFLHEALSDDKPLDRMVTELLMMRGSEREGGSRGFGYAADNDSPFAAKGHIVGTAFLGIEMQCARCHDAPYHDRSQRDLYSIAAMMARKPLVVPKSSTVPTGFFEGRERAPLIEVTLQPGEEIAAAWPFAEETGVTDELADELATDPADARARMAALVTAPENRRFAKVMVNRLWRRLIGAGIVEPAHDWENAVASHPGLLDWLANELLASSYDQKHVLRLIMNSGLYTREAIGDNRAADGAGRYFAAPDRRRMSAEQVVDSLYAASGHEMDVEELTFDPDGRRPATTMISLGIPHRAWQFGSLSNERDRPSLALPKAQAVSDVLKAFGWSPTRPAPVHDREVAPDVLQPGVVANSTLSTWITKASHGSELAELAVEGESPEVIVDSLFLRFLSRTPRGGERSTAVNLLADGFDGRLVPDGEIEPVGEREPLRRVSWTNHLNKEANRIKLVAEQRAREGAAADPRLREDWRERYEDLVWSMINSPEFVWIP